MFNKNLKFCFFFWLLPLIGAAQNCDLKISGYVDDPGTEMPLEAVNVYLNEVEKGDITDKTGFFQLTGLCEGSYHLIISHIGCESKSTFIELKNDTLLSLKMEHSFNVLSDIVVTGKNNDHSTRNPQIINEQNIADNATQSFSTLLESISGVSTIKNGSGISKPVIHGLYGNRLTILNNGIAQSGQQWGNDHSPEIDPLVANKIKVIKGVSALEFPGSNLGSVIIVEPRQIGKEPHLHGKASYFAESNGLSNGLNIQLQKYSPLIAWKVTGTIKKSGDKKTADYFLSNTGSQEANMAVQLEKSFSERLSSKFYFSSFNTEIGVLRGSHIGNLTDLQEALDRETPFFTKEKFSYSIEAPKQNVNHHLMKLTSKYFIDDQQWLDVTLAGQLNKRKEFDVRRSGKSEIPALSLNQFSYFFELKHQRIFNNNLKLKSGFQFNLTDNANDPETGILPLIPDYFKYESGVFAVVAKKVKKSLFDFGVRYDNVLQNVVTITKTTSREIIRYKNTYHNLSTSAGWTYDLSTNVKVSSNIGLASRNPAVNELYSGGLHQGVSGIEEGNIELKTEHSIKATLGINGKLKEWFTFETLVYFQNIEDYIFLNPQDEIRLTIRGAFPVFMYEQTDVHIYGLDFSSQFQITPSLHYKLTGSFIKGENLSNKVPLINMPSNNLTASFAYEFPKLKIGNKTMENFELEMESKYVFEQSNLLTDQDFVAPPNAYQLIGFKVSFDLPLGNTRCRFYSKVDNLFNVAYRDYLNRQRYFADDLGINVTIGGRVKF